MKNQEGSMAMAIMIGLVAIGVATVAVRESQSNLALKAKALQKEQSLEKANVATLNALAQYKALLSPRDIGGRPVPGIFAKNYFQTTNHPAGLNWNIMKSGSFLDKTSFKIDDSASYKGTPILVDVTGKDDLPSAVMVMEGLSNPSQSNKTVYTASIESVNRRQSGIGAGYAIDSAIVAIKKDANVVMRAKVDLPIPTPYGIRIVYRKKKTTKWKTFLAGTALPAGAYEFNAKASGVVREATLKVAGQTRAINVSPGEVPSHKATNFEAKNQLLFADSIPVALNNDEEFARYDAKGNEVCRLINKNEDFNASLSVLGVVDSDQNPPPENQTISAAGKVKESDASVTLDNYQNSCQNQCKWMSAGSGGNSMSTLQNTYAQYFNAASPSAKQNGPIMGMRTASFVFNEAQKSTNVPFFNVRHKILCVSYDGDPKPVNPNSDPQWRSLRRYYTVDKTTCKPEFLVTRLSCGCVAEGTMILLGDGRTEKPIEDLSQSDEIWSPILKKAIGIRYLTRGPEKIPMLTITVGGQELKVTKNHPFPTREGMKSAHQLRIGEGIKIEGKGWQAIEDLTWIDAGEIPPVVWNIYVEAGDDDTDAHHYVANGVITGDLMIQQNLQNAEGSAPGK